MQVRRISAEGVYTNEEDLIVHLEQGEDIRQALKQIFGEQMNFSGYIEVFKLRKDGNMQNFTYTLKDGKFKRVYSLK